VHQKVRSFNERLDARPVFANREEYEEFRIKFRERTQPELKKHVKAHRRSIEQSMTHFVR